MLGAGALESLKTTYSDSEGEDAVNDAFLDYSDSNTPERFPQNIIKSDKSSFSTKRKKSFPSAAVVKRRRLVSYLDDTIISDDEITVTIAAQTTVSTDGNQTLEKLEDNQQFAEQQLDFISDEEEDIYGVAIPPSPTSLCSPELQEKIAMLHKKIESSQLNMNNHIQQRKDFRNPSIYEKLIQFCNIDEFSTNYQPERFDPSKWSKESYYEELAKAQKVDKPKQ